MIWSSVASDAAPPVGRGRRNAAGKGCTTARASKSGPGDGKGSPWDFHWANLAPASLRTRNYKAAGHATKPAALPPGVSGRNHAQAGFISEGLTRGGLHYSLSLALHSPRRYPADSAAVKSGSMLPTYLNCEAARRSASWFSLSGRPSTVRVRPAFGGCHVLPGQRPQTAGTVGTAPICRRGEGEALGAVRPLTGRPPGQRLRRSGTKGRKRPGPAALAGTLTNRRQAGRRRRSNLPWSTEWDAQVARGFEELSGLVRGKQAI
jgi:hypothetical protein